MSESYGAGVSRTLSPSQRQFTQVVMQQDRPPLDADLNLLGAVPLEALRRLTQSSTPSGWLTASPVPAFGDAQSFVTDPRWSNQFFMGRCPVVSDPLGAGSTGKVLSTAIVNGWAVPVSGTAFNGASNRIRLFPAPDTGARLDFVFLEVWQANVAPNPSASNKPSASTLYRYGNTEYGGTNLSDDLADPSIAMETSERVQLQYRIRVLGSNTGPGSGIDLASYPEGLGAPTVLARGTASAPVIGATFTNMGATLGDPGLWRSGDGDPNNALGTVDGYVYAIPIAAIHRRNRSGFTTNNFSTTNFNGSIDRNPSASLLPDPRSGSREFTEATLGTPVNATSLSWTLSGTSDSPLSDLDFSSPRILVLRDPPGSRPTEYVTASALSGDTLTLTVRGSGGTDATAWPVGTTVSVYNPRPDGAFADEVRPGDILDMRHAVTTGQWSYHDILQSNLKAIMEGTLHTTAKTAGSGSHGMAPVVTTVDYMLAAGSSSPTYTELVDGPDGVRAVFSDAAVTQRMVTQLDAGSSTVTWETAPGFVPTKWINNGSEEWSNGSSVSLWVGGNTGTSGARGSFTNQSTSTVRFVSPALEDPTAFRIRFGDIPETLLLQEGMQCTRDGVYPFVALGGVVRPDLNLSFNTAGISALVGDLYNFDLGVTGPDFDATRGAVTEYGLTLDEMILGGDPNNPDYTGASSRLFFVVTGDAATYDNNGVYRVVGVGVNSPTDHAASNATGVVLQPLCVGANPAAGTDNVQGSFRSHYMTSRDGTVVSGPSSAMVVFTDIENTLSGVLDPLNGAITAPVPGRLFLDTFVQYGPGRSAFSRVPDALEQLACVSPNDSLLRQSVSERDPAFATAASIQANTRYYPVQDLRTDPHMTREALARIPDQSRACEAYVDTGSKTLKLTPIQTKALDLPVVVATGSTLYGTNTYTVGPSTGIVKDGAEMFSTGGSPVTNALAIPWEHMPSFGRQDIPAYRRTSATNFWDGVNHLFNDIPSTPSATVFRFVGGPVPGVSGVLPLLFDSDNSLAYGGYGVGVGTPLPVNSPAYSSRKVTITAQDSRDLGTSRVRGIQLPPYLGVARVYGIYERADYIARISTAPNDGTAGAFESNRVTPKANGPVNLLRYGADKQTLYIARDGAADVAGPGAHTYVVTEENIDVTRIPTYTEGDDFDDYQYVVECVCFGFAHGWISENNWVFARRLDGTLTAVPTGTTPAIRMLVPAPAPASTVWYSVQKRTVYQGDPFYTSGVSSPTTLDYSRRYGQIAQSNAFLTGTPITQFDANGEPVLQVPNIRPLEVLASATFWTTMGTGNLTGKTVRSEITDVGNLSGDTRLPESSSAPRFETSVRALTSDPTVTSPATARFVALNPALLADGLSLDVDLQVTTANGVFTVDLSGAYDAGPTVLVDNIATALNNDNDFATYMVASSEGPVLTLVAKGSSTPPIRVRFVAGTAMTGPLTSGIRVTPVGPNGNPVAATLLSGLATSSTNTGAKNTGATFAGATDRLPLGIRVSDWDFIQEGTVPQGFSFFDLTPASSGPLLDESPASPWVAQGDGATLVYAPYTLTSTSGSRVFRAYRGGSLGAVTATEITPVTWATEVRTGTNGPVKSGVLTGVAYLVRNTPEQAFSSPTRPRSFGGELQVVIATSAHYGPGGDVLDGVTSPSEYGFGVTASDRYRAYGRPLEYGPGIFVDVTDLPLTTGPDEGDVVVDDGCP